jgi:hypothetical protein
VTQGATRTAPDAAYWAAAGHDREPGDRQPEAEIDSGRDWEAGVSALHDLVLVRDWRRSLRRPTRHLVARALMTATARTAMVAMVMMTVKMKV